MLAMSLALCGVLVLCSLLVFLDTADHASTSAHVSTSSTQAEKTVMGCTCVGPCGATEDFGFSGCDWCYTKDKCGDFAYSRGAYYDYCVYPPTADIGKSSEQKLNDLWEKITADTTSGSYPQKAKIFAESIQTTFDNVSFSWNVSTQLTFLHIEPRCFPRRQKKVYSLRWVNMQICAKGLAIKPI